MSAIGNVLWILLGGGVILCLEYIVGGLVLCVTIIGIPFGIQCMKLGILALLPFGRKVVDEGGGSGCLGAIMNVLWILAGGIWIAVTHLVFGLLAAITVIGLPFAKQHLKLAGLALAPFGKRIT